MIKKVVNCYYVHKSNISEFIDIVPDDLYKIDILQLYNIYNSSFKYEIIKYDIKRHVISFIDSPDWNVSNEPIVGNSICIYLDNGVIKERKFNSDNPQIYHHKWMFVSDDYDGFDVNASKERSECWSKIPDIKKHKSKIGYKKYWVELLKNNGIEV